MLRHALEEPVEIVGPARDRGLKTLVAEFLDGLNQLDVAGKERTYRLLPCLLALVGDERPVQFFGHGRPRRNGYAVHPPPSEFGPRLHPNHPFPHRMRATNSISLRPPDP